MKIRHLETQDIDYCAETLGCPRDSLFEGLAHPQPIFDRPLFYIAYDPLTENKLGAFAFCNIDYKNRHLILLAEPKTNELMNCAVDYAFKQFSLRKLYLFSREIVVGYFEEGRFRDKNKDVIIYTVSGISQSNCQGQDPAAC